MKAAKTRAGVAKGEPRPRRGRARAFIPPDLSPPPRDEARHCTDAPSGDADFRILEVSLSHDLDDWYMTPGCGREHLGVLQELSALTDRGLALPGIEDLGFVVVAGKDISRAELARRLVQAGRALQGDAAFVEGHFHPLEPVSGLHALPGDSNDG